MEPLLHPLSALLRGAGLRACASAPAAVAPCLDVAAERVRILRGVPAGGPRGGRVCRRPPPCALGVRCRPNAPFAFPPVPAAPFVLADMVPASDALLAKGLQRRGERRARGTAERDVGRSRVPERERPLSPGVRARAVLSAAAHRMRGRLRSTLKEHDSYGKEIKTQSDKIAKMKSDNADFHDIKQQVMAGSLSAPLRPACVRPPRGAVRISCTNMLCRVRRRRC